MDKKPYFYAKQSGSEILVRGENHCVLGHKIYSPNKSEGIFVEWYWDGKTLTVKNDRYGFYPVYYSSFNGEICISPSISRIIKEGVPTDLNAEALSVFFEMGYFIGNDTPFKHIKALPPNVEFRWDGNLTYNSGMPKPVNCWSDISRDEAIDVYISLFEKAIEKRAPKSDFAIPLSGGRDSRHILFELHKQGYKPKVVVTAQNYPDKYTEDVEIAGMISKELGLQHHVLNQEASWFKSEINKNIATDLCSDEHAWLMVVADYLKNEVDIVYDGIAGDSLSESNFLTRKRHNLFKSGKLSALANELIELAPSSRGFTRRGLKTFLKPELVNKVNKKTAVSHLIEELEKHKDNQNPVNSFTLWNRGRREISLVPYRLLSDIPYVYAPYLDHDLFDFLSTLPIEHLLEGNFHSDAIKRAYPEYAHIPFERKRPIDKVQEINEVYARFGKELTLYLLMNRPSQYIRNTFLRTVLLPNLISSRYAAFTRRFTTMALYMQQLDAMAKGFDK